MFPRSLTPIRITTSVSRPIRSSTAGTPDSLIQLDPMLFLADHYSFSSPPTYICIPTVRESPIKMVRL